MRPCLFYRPEPKQSPSLAQALWTQMVADRQPAQHPSPAPTLSPSPPASDCICHKKKGAKTLPIKLWSFPEHCSSYISLVSVWACGWSLSYIHTSGSGLFGTQSGRSQTLRTPSVRGKRSWAHLHFWLRNTWKSYDCLQKHFSFSNRNPLLDAVLSTWLI